MRSLVIWVGSMLIAVMLSILFVTNSWAGFSVGILFGLIAWYVEDFTEWFK